MNTYDLNFMVKTQFGLLQAFPRRTQALAGAQKAIPTDTNTWKLSSTGRWSGL